ncbi:MAG: FAD binding domain-containing protein [Thiohalocapsa sp.]
MKPPPFDYRRPATLAEAAALLGEHGADAKLLAGGQSLMPLLNFRLLRPALLIDINRLCELDFIRDDGSRLRIGALTRHHALETSPLVAARFPVLAAAMTHVAHLAVRNRGTIGGSLAHADPAAELPMLAMLLDAEIRTTSAAGGRMHAARDFFGGPLTTVLTDDEIVTEITLPALPPRTGWGFAEVALRHGDFAIAAVGAVLTVADGKIAQIRVAATGVGETPLRLAAVETLLVGRRVDAGAIEEAASRAGAAVTPPSDLHASADYRRHLVGVLTERVLAEAHRRADEVAA